MKGGNSFIKTHRTGSLFGFLLLVSVVLLSFSSGKQHFQPAELGFQVVSVIQQGFASVEGFFSGTINSISELRRLQDAYDEIQERLKDYEGLEKDLRLLQAENQRLNQELGFTKLIDHTFLPAEVIAKDPVNYFSAIIINKGSLDGVEKNMPVVAFNKGLQGLVGRIIEVGPYSSKIQPIYDDLSFVAARLQTSRYEGLVKGGGGESLMLQMNYVKKRARREIQFGDFVVTSGLNSLFPREIYIGTLTAVEGKEWETSLELQLDPIIEFSRLEYVYVLKGETLDE